MVNEVLVDTKKNNSRIMQYDCLRIFSSFLVILIHVCASKIYLVPVRSFSWNVYNFMDAFARSAVPLFIMLSGAFLLDPIRDESNRKIKNHIRSVLIHFLVWSIVYATIQFGYRLITRQTVLSDVSVFSILKGPKYLWFLLLIIGLYLATPFLRCITCNETLTTSFLELSATFTFVIPYIISICEKFGGGGYSNTIMKQCM